MSTRDLWKALGTAFELWLFYTISTSVFGWSLDSSNFLEVLGALVILIACIAAFVTTVYRQLFGSKSAKKLAKPVKTASEAKKVVENTTPKAFKKEMRMLESQTDRMKRKVDTLNKALKSYFGDSKISYEKFARTIDGVQSVYFENVQNIVNRVNIFDEVGYEELFSRHLEYTEAIEPYNEHFRYVLKKLDENEEILNKMDRLLLEVTNLTDRSSSVDTLPAMEELSELIDQTKLYRQTR